MWSWLLTGALACCLPSGAVVIGDNASVAGVWVVERSEPDLITASYTFKADGTGSSRLGETEVVWAFRWTKSGDDVTIQQVDGAKLTIKAKLLEGGKRLRIYGVTSTTMFTDYKRK